MTEQQKVKLYGHATCPMIPPVVGMLSQSKVDYEYINIRQDADAAARVREINNGYESVPTLIFPDGSTLTEPTAGQLRKKLEAYGYEVPLLGRILGNGLSVGQLAAFAIVIYAILRFLEII